MSTRTDRPYSELGKLLDRIARDHDVRGPYNIAQRVTAATEHRISGQAVSHYFYGESRPRPSFIKAFAEALDLTHEERDELAWFFTYGVHLDGNPYAAQ